MPTPHTNPMPQLTVTVIGDTVHLNPSLLVPVTSPHPAGDTEAILANIGRWLFQARRLANGEG